MPGQVLGTTADGGNAFRFADVNGCQGSSSLSTAAGNDVVYVINVPNNQRLIATLAFPDGGGTSWDSTLNLMTSLANCGTTDVDGGTVGIACASAVDDPEPQTVRYDNLTGADHDVFVLVDAYGSAFGDFGLNVGLSTIPPFVAGGATCAMPAVLMPGSSVRSTTDGGVSNFAFASVTQCRTSNPSTDRTFSLSVPATSRATLDLIPEATFDPIVNVIEGAMNCGMTGPDGGTIGAVCVAGSAAFGSGTPERVVINNVSPSPTSYTIVVDSNSTTARVGNFELSSTITSLPPLLAGGETCAAPVALSPGSIVGTTTGTMNDYAFAAVSGCRASATTGDVVYSLSVPAGNNASLTLTNLTPGFSASLNVISGAANCGTLSPDGGTGMATCVANNSAASTVSVSNPTAAAVTYLVVVDATTFAAPAVGAFQLDVTVAPIPPGDVCASPEVIMMSGVLTGQTTVGFANDIGAGSACTNFSSAYNGRDRVYSIQVGAGQTLTASVSPTTSWDPGVYFILAPASNCLASMSMCVGTGDDTNGSGIGMAGIETGTYTNATMMPQTVFIVVDSFSTTSSGGYDLTVSLMP